MLTSAEQGLTQIVLKDGYDIHHLRGTGPDAVVSFSGIGPMPRQHPPFEFMGSSSARGRNHVIFVRDLRRTWYSSVGLVGSITESLKTLVQKLDVRHLSGIGNSMGGYGAILFAPLLGFRHAIAFAPQYSMDPEVVDDRRWPRWRNTRGPELAKDLSNALEYPGSHFWIIHGYGGYDRQHLVKFPVASKIHHLVVANASHGIAAHLKASARLYPFLEAVFSDRYRDAETALAGDFSHWRSPPRLVVPSQTGGVV